MGLLRGGMAAKRFTQSVVNFKRVGDLVGEGHAKEIAALAVSSAFPINFYIYSFIL